MVGIIIYYILSSGLFSGILSSELSSGILSSELSGISYELSGILSSEVSGILSSDESHSLLYVFDCCASLNFKKTKQIIMNSICIC